MNEIYETEHVVNSPVGMHPEEYPAMQALNTLTEHFTA